MDARAIGVFDSGVGGLTVLQELRRLLPHEEIIYLGDTARVPYGNKSEETILRYAREAAHFLLEQNIKLLVIACHTASSVCLELLQNSLPIPVIGVVKSGFEALVGATQTHHVAILATPSTIRSGIYQALMRKHSPQTLIYPIACPLFVPLIEEGMFDHLATQQIAQEYLAPLIGKVDAALLACTHYPLIHPLIQQVLGPQVTLVEPARHTALEVKKRLLEMGQCGEKKDPKTTFYATDDPGKFSELTQKIFKNSLGNVLRAQY